LQRAVVSRLRKKATWSGCKTNNKRGGGGKKEAQPNGAELGKRHRGVGAGKEEKIVSRNLVDSKRQWAQRGLAPDGKETVQKTQGMRRQPPATPHRKRTSAMRGKIVSRAQKITTALQSGTKKEK